MTYWWVSEAKEDKTFYFIYSTENIIFLCFMHHFRYLGCLWQFEQNLKWISGQLTFIESPNQKSQCLQGTSQACALHDTPCPCTLDLNEKKKREYEPSAGFQWGQNGLTEKEYWNAAEEPRWRNPSPKSYSLRNYCLAGWMERTAGSIPASSLPQNPSERLS